jgi:hypothetical protein
MSERESKVCPSWRRLTLKAGADGAARAGAAHRTRAKVVRRRSIGIHIV